MTWYTDHPTSMTENNYVTKDFTRYRKITSYHGCTGPERLHRGKSESLLMSRRTRRPEPVRPTREVGCQRQCREGSVARRVPQCGAVNMAAALGPTGS